MDYRQVCWSDDSHNLFIKDIRRVLLSFIPWLQVFQLICRKVHKFFLLYTETLQGGPTGFNSGNGITVWEMAYWKSNEFYQTAYKILGPPCTQWCKFISKNIKFPLESRADGEGKLARRRNIKSASFHAHSDSEIYTTEYSTGRGVQSFARFWR